MQKRAVRNVELVLGGESDPHLPEGGLDVAFMSNSYRAFSQPEAMLAAIRRSLKPGGRVVVSEVLRG